MSLRASAPSTENIVRSRFFSSSLKLMDDWPPRSTSRLYPAYGGLWYFAERGKLLPWCRSDNMLDNGGGRDDAPISSPSSSIWISCAVKASDRTNYDRTRRLFTILVRVSRYSEVLEWRMKWSQRSSSLQTTRTDAHARPTPSCRTMWRSLIYRLGSSVRNLLQAKASGKMSAAMNFVTNRISKQN